MGEGDTRREEIQSQGNGTDGCDAFTGMWWVGGSERV